MTIRLATPDDFPFIRSIASREENRPFISDDDETVLQAYIDNPMAVLTIWEPKGIPEGFCYFAGFGAPSKTILLVRLALDKPSSGLGRAFVDDLIAFGFNVLGAQRLWLDVATDNPRAIHAYERAGFQHEGVLRRHWQRPTGAHTDLAIMGLLREEWAG